MNNNFEDRVAKLEKLHQLLLDKLNIEMMDKQNQLSLVSRFFQEYKREIRWLRFFIWMLLFRVFLDFINIVITYFKG